MTRTSKSGLTGGTSSASESLACAAPKEKWLIFPVAALRLNCGTTLFRLKISPSPLQSSRKFAMIDQIGISKEDAA